MELRTGILLLNLGSPESPGTGDVRRYLREFLSDPFVLDMPVERASSRLTRELDRMESRGPDFLNRVRKGFLNEARQHPDSFIVIDADRTIDEIQTDIRSAAKRVLQTPLDEHLGEVQP